MNWRSLFRIRKADPVIVVRSYVASGKIAVLILGSGDMEIVGQAGDTPEGREDVISYANRIATLTGLPYRDERPIETDYDT